MKREHMIHIRVNKEEKEEASEILDELGTSLSSVINMLIKNVILYRGIPFEVVLPTVDKPSAEDIEHHSDKDSGGDDDSVSQFIPNKEEFNDEMVQRNGAHDIQNDIFDMSDLDLMGEMLGISLGDYKTPNTVSGSKQIDLKGILDD